jgi:hypothetical protein
MPPGFDENISCNVTMENSFLFCYTIRTLFCGSRRRRSLRGGDRSPRLSPDIDGRKEFREASGPRTGIREPFAPAHPTIRERSTLGTFGVSSAVLCATSLEHG